MIDPRLEEIRKTYERKVVERFVESYVEALRECSIVQSRIIANHPTETHVLHDEKVYVVANLKCECEESERSGIGCCHEICSAIQVPWISYSKLVSARWLKKTVKKSTISDVA